MTTSRRRGGSAQADELTADERRALDTVAAHVGSSVVDASRVPWGDSRAAYRALLSDGRSVAARYVSGPGALDHARAVVQRSDRLAASGVAVAHPAQLGPADDATAWIITPWVDGQVGSMALGAPGSSLELADRMGRLAARIATVDMDGLDVNRSWAGPDALHQAASDWLAAVRDAVDPGTYLAVRQALTLVVEAWDSDAPWQVGMSHGDFAPINVIVATGGDLVLLDMDDVGPGPRLLDVAWWGWVVHYHHPAAWAGSWSTFVAAAGLEREPGLDAAATDVARVRLLERAAGAPDTRRRAMWLGRLEDPRGWKSP